MRAPIPRDKAIWKSSATCFPGTASDTEAVAWKTGLSLGFWKGLLPETFPRAFSLKRWRCKLESTELLENEVFEVRKHSLTLGIDPLLCRHLCRRIGSP